MKINPHRSSLRGIEDDEANQLERKPLFVKNLNQSYALLFSWFASSSSIPRNDDRWKFITDITVSNVSNST